MPEHALSPAERAEVAVAPVAEAQASESERLLDLRLGRPASTQLTGEEVERLFGGRRTRSRYADHEGDVRRARRRQRGDPAALADAEQADPRAVASGGDWKEAAFPELANDALGAVAFR
jgi:hypothetical protein